MKEISGPFEVSLIPAETDDPNMGQMALEKSYSGSLNATAVGTMLTGMGKVRGSAGYVAIEKVSGSLEGIEGSFMLQHFGIQQGESKTLQIVIVPDSGTGDLAGIHGTMQIENDESGHKYILRYALPTP